MCLCCARLSAVQLEDEIQKSLNRQNKGLIREKVGLNKCKTMGNCVTEGPAGIERLGRKG